MPSVTAFTAARSLAIEQQAVVGAEVVNGDLIMRRQNNSTFNAGSVAGPEGPPGPTGDVSLSQLNNAIASLQDQIDATGLGIVGRVEVMSNFSLPSSLVWHDVPGAAVTFTPSPGRLYRIEAHAAMINNSVDQTTQSIQVVDASSGAIIAADGVCTDTSGYAYYPKPSRLIVAPVGWNVSKTLKVQAYSRAAGTFIEGTNPNVQPGTALYIEDLGPV